MKKHLLTLFTFLLIFNTLSKAGVGDTTWVQANIVNLDYYNNFDVRVKFPDASKTYRQILEVFTLGEYTCTAGTQYCHQWDYTVTNFVLTPTDTAEISRFITPYANTGVPRFPTTWKQPYVFDVTDYSPILHDSATVRINYSGYSGGFTANVRFAFIEGVPARDVVGVQKLWSNYFTYGNPADPIANHVTPYTLNVPSGAVSSELKFTITGHGADATDNCCEFSNNNAWHSYSVLLNSSTVGNKLIYRDDCGSNELYPQGGTWIYNRANWCPGSAVLINTHPLPSAATGNQLGVNFSSYSSTGSFGGYQINGAVIYYGGFNHTLDAELSEIISPNADPNYFRENPAGSLPSIRVKNTGSTTINSVKIQYNIKDSVFSFYTWTGTLAPLKDTVITLPALKSLTNLSLNKQTGMFQFIAKVVEVNGSLDNDISNNTQQSNFIIAPNWPNKFIVSMKTNSEGVSGIGVSPSETSWKITDMNNNTVASRTNADVSKIYNDTVVIGTSGFYKLTITDLGCDGLHWWVYDQNPQIGVTAGTFMIKKSGVSGNIPMNGYSYSGTFNNDFGCSFTQYFTTNGFGVGIADVVSNPNRLEIYPTPAVQNQQLYINSNLLSSANTVLYIFDALGRTILTQSLKTSDNGPVGIDTRTLEPGLYQILLQNGSQQVSKKFTIR